MLRLSELDPQRAQRVSALVDDALELDRGERGAWLARLAEHEPELAPLVAELIGKIEDAADAPRVETGELLARRIARLATTEDEGLEGRRVGPYRVLGLLGRGGMGSVWLAERADGLFERQVALKLVHPALFGGALAERFARERRILAALDHPNIARLIDAGVTDDGRSYLALEYVEGKPLNAYCDGARLSVADRVRLFLQVLVAVQHAHQHLVVHRDLKPSNILVAASGQVRLLDFGIAKLVGGDQADETELTQLGGRALTPAYASPEQIAGRPITTASDVYSLGVVLYELLCGVRPYRPTRDSPAALEEAVLASEPLKPSQAAISETIAERRSVSAKRLRRALEGDLDTIVAKALKKDAGERYATAEALAQDLRSHLAGEAVLARPDSVWYRTRRFVARNRLAVGAATATALAVVTGAALAVWQARVAEQQAAIAVREAGNAKAAEEFLLDIFRTNSDTQADPIRARQTTARELLDLAASRIGTKLADAPDLRDQMFDELADLYFQLGLDERAADMQALRIEALERLHKERDPRMVDALISFFRDAFFTQRRPDGVAALMRARTILDDSGDRSSELRGQLLTELAKAKLYASLPEMMAHADEAVTLYRRHHPDAPAFSNALQIAGRARLMLGDYPAAEALYEEALAQARRFDPPVLAQLTTTQLELADTQAAMLKLTEAEGNYRAALARSRQHNGEQHVDTLMVAVRMGAFLHSTGRRSEGRDLLQSAMDGVGRDPGTAIPNITGQVHRRYGAAMLAEGNLAAATEHLAAAGDIHARYYPGSAVQSVVMRDQAALLAALGRYSAAEQQLAEAWQTWRRVSGSAAEPHSANRYALQTARLRLDRGEADAAIEAARSVAPPPGAAATPLRLDDVEANSTVAAAQLQANRTDDARRSAFEALAEVRRSALRDRYPALEAEASLRAGQAAHRAGDLRAARLDLERALELRQATDHPASPWLAEVQIALADCLIDLGDRNAARALVAKAGAIHAQHRELGEHFRMQLDRVAARLR